MQSLCRRLTVVLFVICFLCACAEPNLHFVVELPEGFNQDGLVLELVVYAPSDAQSASCDDIEFGDLDKRDLSSAVVFQTQLLPAGDVVVASSGVPRYGKKIVLVTGTYSDSSVDTIRLSDAVLALCKEIDDVDSNQTVVLHPERTMRLEVENRSQLILSALVDGATNRIRVAETDAAGQIVDRYPKGIVVTAKDYLGDRYSSVLRVRVYDDTSTLVGEQMLQHSDAHDVHLNIDHAGTFSIEFRTRFQLGTEAPLDGLAYENVVDSDSNTALEQKIKNSFWVMPGPFGLQAPGTPARMGMLSVQLEASSPPSARQWQLTQTGLGSDGQVGAELNSYSLASREVPRYHGFVTATDASQALAYPVVSSICAKSSPTSPVLDAPGKIFLVGGDHILLQMEMPASGSPPCFQTEPSLINVAFGRIASLDDCLEPLASTSHEPFVLAIRPMSAGAAPPARHYAYFDGDSLEDSEDIFAWGPQEFLGSYCVTNPSLGYAKRIVQTLTSGLIPNPVFTDLGQSPDQDFASLVDNAQPFVVQGMLAATPAVGMVIDGHPELLSPVLLDNKVSLKRYRLKSRCTPNQECSTEPDYISTIYAWDDEPRATIVRLATGYFRNPDKLEVVALVVRTLLGGGNTAVLYLLDPQRSAADSSAGIDVTCDANFSDHCNVYSTDIDEDGITELLLTTREALSEPAARHRARVIRFSP